MMHRIWAMAALTFRQSLRTRVAAVFGGLLAVVLAVLPSAMEGDGTLAGRIRTFLDYGTAATAVLLSLTVVLLSTGLVANDVRDKHVFVVCTKPLGRAQYILGRWLGLVMLSAVLLAAAGAAIYAVAQYLRGREDLAVGPEDARAVEMEVFTARASVSPRPPDVDRIVPRIVERMQKEDRWTGTVQLYKDKYKLQTPQQAESLLYSHLREAVLAEAQSVPPGQAHTFEFDGIPALGQPVRGGGEVLEIVRDQCLLRVRTDPAVARRLVVFGPVWVKDMVGRVEGLWTDGFRAAFALEDMKAPRMADLRPGSQVEITVEPAVQISYKVSPAGPMDADKRLRAAWQVENAGTGFLYFDPPREIPVNAAVSLLAPVRAVDGAGHLRARYLNFSPHIVTILRGDVTVMFPVGSFEANYVKDLGLILMGLMYLAALGVLAGSFLSFPVACFACFALLLFAVPTAFLREAVELLEVAGKYPDPLVAFSKYSLEAMLVVLPDLASTLRARFLVDGLAAPWAYLGTAAALTVLIRGGIALLLACLIFRRRELAQVQV